MDLAPYRAFLHELAEKSGDFIRPFFGRPGLAVETKEDQSPVTEADRGAEKLMRELIAKKYPAHGVIGEEFGEHNPGAEFTWVLDPVDGTKAFAAACPLFGTLIALLHQGRPVLGAIHQPVLRQLLVGDGRSATLNGRSARLRPCRRIEDALLLTGDAFNPARYRNGPAFEDLARRAKLYRGWGDCYGYLLVATGWADIMCDPIMNPWDIQALIPVVRGAGGTITDWHGGDPVKADSIVAAGPELHAQVIAALNP
ncbi:MAG TPA: histidinol-phosphatase [Opitutaceae bacterium]|nr:histidinol-phosphatase [Opitutaceae bacterium]